MNGAADGEVARDVDVAEPRAPGGLDRDATSGGARRDAPAAASISSVWSRVGSGSTTVVAPVGVEARRAASPTSPARSRPAARSRSRCSGAALDHDRRVAVGRLDPRAHPAQRLGDPLHRPRARATRRRSARSGPAGRRGCRRAGASACPRCRSRSARRRRRPRRPTPWTTSRVDRPPPTSTPSARTAATVASVSPERPKPRDDASRPRRARRAAPLGARSTCRPARRSPDERDAGSIFIALRQHGATSTP